jgi:beta-lactamase regulating signal transducer with metallopeptidase domain
VDDLLRIGISNAVAATILALIAFAVSRMVRRPALSHVLWLLVLVKLITPPIRSIEFEWPTRPPVHSVEKAAVPAATPQPIMWNEQDRDVADVPEVAIVDVLPAEPAAPAVELLSPQPPASTPWSVVAGFVWVSGSLFWFTFAGLRVYHFRRLLLHARSAPSELRCEVEHLAQELGIRRVPTVRLVPGRISPLLWWLVGPPALFLPSQLWKKLNADQRTALLVHELAHLRRGDHWVRLLEMLTTGLYWWNPVLWLARHELREAEEQCCDAWVVWALPGAGRTYALALVETLDFLSETRTSLPAAASGLGQVRNLRRRLSMIMRGTTPRRLSWAGLVTVLGAAALLLPLVPTLAQDRLPEEQEARARRAQAEAALQRAEAELQKARADIEAARLRAQNAERNARQQRDRVAGASDDQPQAYVVIIQDGKGREVRRIQARPGQTIRLPGGDGPGEQPPPGEVRFGRDPGAGGPPGATPGPANVKAGQPGGRGGPGGGPMMPGAGAPMAGGPGGPPGTMAGPGGGDQERRLQNIERRLDEIMRTMERFMREQDRRQPQPDKPGSPRRESRGEDEEDIKVRPGTRVRTPSDRAPEVPATGPRPGATSVPPAAPVPERPPVPGADTVPARPPVSNGTPDLPSTPPASPSGTPRR